MPGRRLMTVPLAAALMLTLGVPLALAQSLVWRDTGPDSGDEIFFYSADGAYSTYNLPPDGDLPSTAIGEGSTESGWDEISAIDLDGDGQDEMLFYRQDGTFSFNEVNFDGSLGDTISSGSHYTQNWSTITAIDLDGDGQDEIFFYRDDGLYRYYNIRPDGSLPAPMQAGDEYTTGWDSITAVDLDGDGQDEMFFYREDGLYRYYNIKPDGTIPKPLTSGSEYTTGWGSIFAIDLDGDGQDEMFFYREDGLYRYYNIRTNGTLPKPLNSGADYPVGVDAIVGVEVDWHPRANTVSAPVEPVIVNSPFGPRLHPILGIWLPHEGVDLDTDSGDPIHSAAAGVVVFAGWQGGYGNVVEVDHGGELRTLYAHLSSIGVAVGAWVESGDVLGLAGSTGLSTGPHLHFETIEWGEPVDPMTYLPQ